MLASRSIPTTTRLRKRSRDHLALADGAGGVGEEKGVGARRVGMADLLDVV
jgi:hypothetical protein